MRKPRKPRTELLESREMLALPELPGLHHIPDFSANPTVDTVASGNWSDPAIWSTGSVPTTSDIVKVNTSHDVTLTAPVDINTLGVAGTLTVSNEIRLQHGIVYAGGSLDMDPGTEMIIKDLPFHTEDTRQWGNGLIVQGTWTADDGIDKTAYVRSLGDINAGDTSVTLESIPDHWKPGDRVVFPETVQGFLDGSQSEERVITSIDDNVVTLDAALNFDHHGTPNNPFGVERFPHVANLTRDILIRSEDSEGVRGHTAINHMAEVDLNGVEFRGLGRTEATPVSDNGVSPAGFELNQVGRYPFHAHHVHTPTGVSLIDSVVDDGMKWGVTIHQTNNSLIQNNVVHNTDGAAFATEDGPEFGNEFIGNLVIKVDGGYQTGSIRAGATEHIAGVFVDTGSEGSGFWLRGPASYIVGNAVYDVAGYTYNANGYYRRPDPYGVQTLLEFTDNEGASSRGGLWLSWSQDGENVNNFLPQTWENSLFWNVHVDGVKAFHDANNTFSNITVINDPAVSSTNQGSDYVFDARITTAFHFGHSQYENFNTTLNNVKASGSNVGLLVPVHSGPNGTTITGSHFQNWVNIAYNNGADPDTTTITDITYTPTDVQRVGTQMPETPANVWHEVHGVVEVGESTGSTSTPPALPPEIEIIDGWRLKVSGSSGNDTADISSDGINITVASNGVTSVLPVGLITRIEYRGLDGDDTVTISGGVTSYLYGGNGNDSLMGGDGNDKIYGDAGNDWLDGRGGDDIVYGGTGDDRLLGGDGVDRLRGEDGEDVIEGGAGNDHTLDGGPGNDWIDGGAGGDRIFGKGGDDVLYGGPGGDKIWGGDGNDMLFGEGGNNVLFGEAGTDGLTMDYRMWSWEYLLSDALSSQPLLEALAYSAGLRFDGSPDWEHPLQRIQDSLL